MLLPLSLICHVEVILVFVCLLSQIVIEGVRGSSFNGDIAIDDFLLRKGSCSMVHNVSTTAASTSPATMTAVTSTAVSTTTKAPVPGRHNYCSCANSLRVSVGIY